MKIAIIEYDESISRKIKIILEEKGHNLEIYLPTSKTFNSTAQDVSDFDPDLIFVAHSFTGFTGENLVVDTLDYSNDYCIGLGNNTAQKNYCHKQFDTSLDLDKTQNIQILIEMINSVTVN